MSQAHKPRLGAHTFIWADDWTRDNAVLVIEQAAKAGLEVVEIPLLRPGEVDVDHTKALASEHDIALTCSLGLPNHATLPEFPDKAETFLKQALDTAAALGSWCLTGVTYSTIGKLTGGPPTESEYETIARSLKPVARHAASLELALGLEPCNRYETHLLNTGAQTVEMIERIGEPNLFVHLDTYHMNIEEKGFAGPIQALGSHLRYIHLSESDRGIPGTGNVNWADVFAGLRDINFTVDMVVESFLSVHPDIAAALSVWRPVAPSVDALVTEGYGFLRREMETASKGG
ncbi:MAG: sugar phosphate isomerase/epimerase family protein [Geminicoccaceae bacterium]